LLRYRLCIADNKANNNNRINNSNNTVKKKRLKRERPLLEIARVSQPRRMNHACRVFVTVVQFLLPNP